MREFPSWIDGFMECNSHLPVPEIFLRWAAIATVAGALERKVWTRIYAGKDLFPNLYTVIVATPGGGKTLATAEVNKLWASLQTHKVAASSVTAAALGDELRDAQRNIIRPNCVPVAETFNSLLIASDELSVFMPAYETTFLSKLVTLYDCDPYSERRRTKSENTYRLEKPQLNFLAATQPAYLQTLLPEAAWDQGFASRCIFIYSGEEILRPLFEEEASSNPKAAAALTRGLKHISTLQGKLKFTDEAADSFSSWHLAGGPPKPDHPKLQNYNKRRTVHIAKLCMIACLDESDEPIITLPHFKRALAWLLEAEHYMPDIFKSMRHGGDTKAMEDLWYFAFQIYSSNKQPLPEAKLVRYLQERTPAHNVMRILETMTRADLFRVHMLPGVGKCYTPQAQTPQ